MHTVLRRKKKYLVPTGNKTFIDFNHAICISCRKTTIMLFAYKIVRTSCLLHRYHASCIKMHIVQRSLHKIRKRAWEHKKALLHMNRAIIEMEAVYEYASHNYEPLKISINEMKRYRAQENFEYQNALSILRNYDVFTA